MLWQGLVTNQHFKFVHIQYIKISQLACVCAHMCVCVRVCVHACVCMYVCVSVCNRKWGARQTGHDLWTYCNSNPV